MGITGSVAAIKAHEIVELLSHWAELKVIATEHSKPFLKLNKSFAFLDDQTEWHQWQKKGDSVLHIELRKWADLFLIAPLTANSLAKISYGFADNLLTSVAKAWDFNKPFLVAPAMNTFMWNHPETQSQIKKISAWNITIIPPIEKVLACGDEGTGAMEEPQNISNLTKKIVTSTKFK